MYKVADDSDIIISGSIEAQAFLMLFFIPCRSTLDQECASEDEISKFLEEHDLALMSTANYVNMEEVLDEKDSLKASA